MGDQFDIRRPFFFAWKQIDLCIVERVAVHPGGVIQKGVMRDILPGLDVEIAPDLFIGKPPVILIIDLA